MPSVRRVFTQLCLEELLACLQAAGIAVLDCGTKQTLIKRVLAAPDTSLDGMLLHLKRDRLQSLCLALGIDDSGRDKSALVTRLLSRDGQSERAARTAPRRVRFGQANLVQADCISWLRTRKERSIHAVVTDPPYGLREFSEIEKAKLASGRGGVWRIPPNLNGSKRMPLPRFTTLSDKEHNDLTMFFVEWARLVFRVLVPGGHVIVATNPLVSHFAYMPLITAGFEKRGEIIRLVQTLRGGDRPKNAHSDFPDVSVMPRSGWEPWGLFRKPCEASVKENLRKWHTGGLRRESPTRPFTDVIACGPTRGSERMLSNHPSLKPQRFMRQVVRAALPVGEGIVLDPFMGGGSTIAAAEFHGYKSIGIEADPVYFGRAVAGIPRLVSLSCGKTGTF